ncbi:CLUMA_CG018066, isoform A [Clunio marinus]|uniref:CLUMA_CG018066, isoform A n=1 Tax=Clunio marinus TaxID=568069 RepID=A0A1J1J255_9DIPT|nr:CLUMA_CG018066, isoform A [Clunio marinus]
MDKENRKRPRFAWTRDSVNLLIDLYGENIESFLNPYKIKTKLWSQLVELMKQDDSLSYDLREELTVGIARRKFLSLQKEFKRCYYEFSSPVSMKSPFPHYKKLLKLFTDYATKKLNQKNESFGIADDTMNQTTQEEISAYIKNHILDNTLEEHEVTPTYSSLQPSLNEKSSIESRAAKLRQEIAKMSKDSLSIHEEKIKIVPNTPFNARYQLSTIINYKNTRNNSLKRSNLEDNGKSYAIERSYIKPIIKRSLPTINPNDNEYEVEALDECSFYVKENISSNKDEVIMQPASSTMIKGRLSNETSNDNISEMTEEQSVLEIPPLPTDSIDDLRCGKIAGHVNRKLPLIRKTLNWSEEISELNHENSNIKNDSLPNWFQSFITKYDSDIKKLDDKLNIINNILFQFKKKTFSVCASVRLENADSQKGGCHHIVFLNSCPKQHNHI